MAEITELRKHIINYAKTHEVYVAYRTSGYSKAYYEEHEDAIKLCKAIKRAFDEITPYFPKYRRKSSRTIYIRFLRNYGYLYTMYFVRLCPHGGSI